MGAKGKPSSNAERIAGAKNLKKYTDQHGHGSSDGALYDAAGVHSL